jgi:hypothetical protein
MIAVILIVVVFILSAYILYPWYCRWGTTYDEAIGELPGDEIVPDPETEYTLTISIKASPSEVWPWLIQMGQGRGGFYTHEWIENLIGADVHNADRIIQELQHLDVGDPIRLTPDPYLGGQPGQYIVVAQLEPLYVLIFRQVLPNGEIGSWSYVLEPTRDGATRLIFRRRAGQPSLFDRVMEPGYYFMDTGMLAGIKKRAESRAYQPMRDTQLAR